MSHQYRLGIIVDLLPAAMLFGTALLVAVLGAVRPGLPPSFHRWLSSLGFVAAIAASLIGFAGLRSTDGIGLITFAGGIVTDRFGIYAEVVLSGIGLLAVLGEASAARRLGARSPAFFALVLTATGAGTLLAGQREMAMLLLGAGLLLTSLVGLVALEKTSLTAAEAALKQLVGSGLAFALLVYGLAVIYGATGSTDLLRTRGDFVNGAVLEGLGLSLCLLGLAHLLGAAPLHQWVLTVATASSGAVSAAVLGLGCTAGAITLVRVAVGGFGPQLRPWLSLASLLAALACLYPALLAVGETRVRRLAGLGVCLQGGLMLTAVLGSGIGGNRVPADGVTALMFAIVVFALAVLATFQGVAMLESGGIDTVRTDARGLARRSPGAAVLLCLGLAALAGLPPMAGFLGRIFIAAATLSGGYAWVAVISVVASILYAIPVLRVLGSVLFEESEGPVVIARAPFSARIVGVTCGLLGLAATLLAEPLLLVAHGAAAALR